MSYPSVQLFGEQDSDENLLLIADCGVVNPLFRTIHFKHTTREMHPGTSTHSGALFPILLCRPAPLLLPSAAPGRAWQRCEPPAHCGSLLLIMLCQPFSYSLSVQLFERPLSYETSHPQWRSVPDPAVPRCVPLCLPPLPAVPRHSLLNPSVAL